MLRSKMNRLIRILEAGDMDKALSLMDSPKYTKALNALEASGCVKSQRAWGGEVVHIALLNRSAVYELERQDLWINRIVSFCLGVATTVAAGFLLHIVL